MNNQPYQHWQLTQDDNAILWLAFNRQDQPHNSINAAVLKELDEILTATQQQATNPVVKGIVIYSAKEKGFIVGADVRYFSQFTTAQEIEAFLHQGQAVFNKLAALPVPTVAMIKGFCLGGGLELALACRYRLAEESEDTRIGLPEVLLGIQPGWGGSVRLPRLVGPLQALSMMLRGETLSARAAAKIGLVDALVPKRQWQHAAIYYIQHSPSPRQPVWWHLCFEWKWLRSPVARYMRKQLMARANPEHYPAPFAMIDNWEQVGVAAVPGQAREVATILRLLQQNQTAKNLIRVFFLQERLKNTAKETDSLPTHIHVVGAGIMGGDIAAWCALSGFTVTLQDVSPQKIAAAMARAGTLYKKKLRDKRLITAAFDRLIPDVIGAGVSKADIIIEAIIEDLAAKQSLFQALESRAKPTAILATNTSSIPLDEINQVMQDPARLVGIHFFNPVAKMKLVEVVQGASTSPHLIAQACAFVGKLNHLPLPVRSGPGFLVNRLLMPYLMEAMVLFDEGIPAAEIDKAAVAFGMPMGPLALGDTVGLDICLAVAQHLTASLGGTVPKALAERVAAGKLGRKTGEGFYNYHQGKPLNKESPVGEAARPAALSQTEIANRLISRLLQEAKVCLQEKVVEDADLLDAGMIFGAGFAPFRGGPMHYMATLSEARV